MMHKQTQTKQPTRNQKITYSSICEIFELNFNKILRLVPLLPSIKDNFIAIKYPSNNLHLICHEKSPYTGTYTLTHKIKSQGEIISRPNICFKIYFDAKLLEVISICKDKQINRSYSQFIDCSDLVFQFEVNLFMLRWLDYCLEKYNRAEWMKQK